ncbi:MAG: tetratricopeptide repeat protein [Deltaproteobacteria bacterium]|nr:tetratricopeptide repeat protein [Deltaproteobacteria bacterium]
MTRNIPWQKLTAIVTVTGLSFLVYAQVLHFGFANIDDSVYVTQNPHVLGGLSIENLKWALTSTFAGFWHPLTWLSLMLDAQIYGAWAGGYHLTNLLLHIVSSLLLFAFLREMTGSFWRSGFVAALFALHPLHVESVAWIGERKDVLSAFWGMITLCTYGYYVKQPGVKRYLLVLIAFLLGLMSKPMLVTLPFVMLLMDYWPLARISFPFSGNKAAKSAGISNKTSIGRLIGEKVPLFLLVIPISFVTFFAEGKFGALPTLESFPLNVRIGNAIISYVRYIGKTLLPDNLSIYYPHPGLWPVWQVIIAAGILVLFTLWVLRKSGRYPYLIVGWLWYLGTLVPVIGLIQVGPSAIADRYTYIPIIGLFIMLAWGIPDKVSRLPQAKTFLGIGAILLIAVFSFLSWQRCQLWGDNFLLWDDVLKKYDLSGINRTKENQRNAFAYNFRGMGHAEHGRYRQAIDDYNTALKISGNFGDALNNRANAYAATGQNDLALADYAKLISINPKYADAYFNRGNLYLSLGAFDKAVYDFTEALKIDSTMADAFNNRGVAYRMQGQYEKAFADFTSALSINRKNAESYFNKGVVFYMHAQYLPAIANFTEALKIKPRFADSYFFRGLSFAALGKNESAASDLRSALNSNANHLQALHGLADLLFQMKRYEEASAQYQKILLINPEDRNAQSRVQEIGKLRRSMP